jgi:serine/threonine protein kinase/WD40 repeat protein
MTHAGADRDPVERVAEEFLQRHRRGERPALREYEERYPDLAEQIRALFPTLLLLERLPPAPAGRPGPEGGTPPPVPLLPERLGDYRLLRQLGRGGMGVVYEAVQESLGRHVALKVLPAGRLLSPTQRERFRREARAAARLHHTNIVPVFEVGEHDGVPYYAMQFIHGQGLDAVLEEVKRLGTGPAAGDFTAAQGLLSGAFAPAPAPADPSVTAPVTPPASGSGSQLGAPAQRPYYRSVARLGVQAAEALDYAHRQGILHRDVKPSNLLLDAHGTIWVTDFGLAKADDEHDLTGSGDVVGTLRFLAPERFRGRADGRSDVYALGATLYEMVTLRPALEGIDRVQLVERATRGAVPPVRQHDPAVPLDLATVIHKALAPDPERRYPTAGDLAADLRRFLDGVPIRARRSGPAERLWSWCRRNPVVSGLLAAVALLLVAVAGVASVSAWRLGAEAGRARAAEREANEQLFQSSLERARASRFSGRMGQRFAGLEALRKAAELARVLDLPAERVREVGDEAIACLALTDLRVVRQWPVEENPAWTDIAVPVPPLAAFDADLGRYASGDAQGVVRVREVGSDRELARIPPPPGSVGAASPSFSPDGRFLAVDYHWSAGAIDSLLWDLGAGRAVARFRGRGDTNVLGFRPDGRGLFTHRPDGAIELRDPAGTLQGCLKAPTPVDRLALAPDGRRLACTGDDPPVVYILDLETGQVVRTLAHPDRLWDLAWSPDGRLLAAACKDHKAYVWDARDGKLQSVLEGHHWQVASVAFSPDGALLATGSMDGTTRLWEPIRGTSLVTAPGRCAGFARDGGRLAFVSGSRLGVWEVANGRECRPLPYGRARPPLQLIGDINDVDFGAGGRLLAACGNDGVRFWDAATGAEAGFLPLGRHETSRFDAAGTRLFTYGRTGFRSWPVEPVPGAPPGALRVGPPRPFDLPPNDSALRADRDRDAQVLAVTDYRGHRVILLDGAGGTRTVLDQGTQPVADLALSPDGRWLALCHYYRRLSVWDIAGGRTLAPPPAGMGTLAGAGLGFSPDGRWLVAGRPGDYRLWRVGRWQDEPLALPRENTGAGNGPFAFSPDGRFLALVRTPLEVQLLDTTTFEEVARLLAPDARYVLRLRFSPDGSRLAVGTINQIVYLWDLRSVRAGLADLGLDAGLGPYPAEALPPGDRLRLVLLPDTIEAENLHIAAAENCPHDVRDTSARGPEAWSNNRELYGAAAEGGYLEVEVDVSRTGRYALGITFTQAPDFGLVEVSVDGRRLGPRFDGFAEKIARSTKTDFGTVALGEGPHRLRFTAVGKNPRAAGCHLAVDCLELLPADDEGGGSPPPRS